MCGQVITAEREMQIMMIALRGGHAARLVPSIDGRFAQVGQ